MKTSPNYTGQKFNKLTITRQYLEPPFTRSRAECICECGKIVDVVLSKILNGHTKSCGCFRKGSPRPRLRKEYGYSSFIRLLNSYKQNAKKRNLEFSLLPEEAKILFQKKCFYCDSSPTKIMTTPKSYGEFYYNGIDRLDNNQGYTKENSVPCCALCNFTKNKMHYHDFINWIRKVSKHTSHLKI